MSDPIQPDVPTPPQPDVPAPSPQPVMPPPGPPGLPGNDEPVSVPPGSPYEVPGQSEPLGVPPVLPGDVSEVPRHCFAKRERPEFPRSGHRPIEVGHLPNPHPSNPDMLFASTIRITK